jgi:cbb3-type cytochrome oxidase cytochrome c subunit
MRRAASILALVAVCGVVVALAQRDSPTAESARLRKGAEIYLREGCSNCHSIAGKIAAKGGVRGVPLDGVGTRLTAKEIRAALLKPRPTAASTVALKMKSYAHVSATDLDNLVAYVGSLKTLDTPR